MSMRYCRIEISTTVRAATYNITMSAPYPSVVVQRKRQIAPVSLAMLSISNVIGLRFASIAEND
jgi:hypothetical protein